MTNQILLRLVVQGTEVLVDANRQAPLRAAAQRALAQAGDYGRPLSDWEVKSESGASFDVSRTVDELGLVSGALLYMTLLVGANGVQCTPA